MIAYAVLVALLVAVVWYARRARRAIDLVDEIDAMADRVFRLERHLKLTAGRLNSLAPPREGTGKANGDEGDRPVGRPMTRAELYAEISRRRKEQG